MIETRHFKSDHEVVDTKSNNNPVMRKRDAELERYSHVFARHMPNLWRSLS